MKETFSYSSRHFHSNTVFHTSFQPLTIFVKSCIFNVWMGSRSSHQRCYAKKLFLKISQNSQENNCARVSFLIRLQASACSFIKKETLTEVFSCEYCKTSKNIFFNTTPLVAASLILNAPLHALIELHKKWTGENVSNHSFVGTKNDLVKSVN